MDDVEKTRQEALEILRSIQTLDDFKEHKDDIFDFLEKMLGAAIMALKEFMSNMMGMAEDERMKNLEKFQDESYLFGPELDQEMDRIMEI